MAFEKELEIAIAATLAAGKIQKVHFQKEGLVIELKADQSPVTQVDKESESVILSHLKSAFPEDAILSEESEAQAGTSGRRWIIDPLDGTRPFIRRLPYFSVLIALEENRERVLGVMYFPALDETYYAVKGGGAFFNDRKISVSKNGTLEKSQGAFLGFQEKDDFPGVRGIKQLAPKVDYLFGFNDAWSYACLASGKMDFVISLLDSPWDCAPISIIIKEAGGQFSDIDGNNKIDSGNAVATNGLIHESLMKVLGRNN